MLRLALQQHVSLFFVANALMCLWRGVLSDVNAFPCLPRQGVRSTVAARGAKAQETQCIVLNRSYWPQAARRRPALA